MLFLEIMPMLVEDTNRYCCQYLGTLDGHCPLPTALGDHTRKVLVLITCSAAGAKQEQYSKNYWLTLEQFFMAFYGHTVKCDKLYHILRFLNFSDSDSIPDKADENETGFGK